MLLFQRVFAFHFIAIENMLRLKAATELFKNCQLQAKMCDNDGNC